MRPESDTELIRVFVERDDQDAFAEIVSRHGAMVYRVCFRKLLNSHDAEEASQAVFMTLVKKSKNIQRGSGSIAAWLHTVARQTALFVARTRVRRVHRETSASEINNPEKHFSINAYEQEEVSRILDQELSALSDVQREAVILRYMNDLSEKEASLIAGCAPNTLSRRTSDGIAKLRKRFSKRGFALGVPALISILGVESQAAVPQTLIPSLLAVPKLFASGAATASLTMIMEGALKAMAMTKIKTVGVGILIILLVGMGTVLALKKIQGSQLKVKGNSSINEGSTLPNPPSFKKRSFSTKQLRLAKTRNFLIEADQAFKEGDENLKGIMRDWFDHDRDNAWVWTKKHWRGWTVEIVSSVWAEQDPEATATWAINNISNPNYKAVALFRVGEEWAKQDLERALEWAMNLPKGQIKNMALGGVICQWAEDDIAKMKEWISKHADGEEKSFMLSFAAYGVAKNNPETAAKLAIQIPTKYFRGLCKKGLTKSVEEWVKKDPIEVVAWVKNLPEGEVGDWAFYRLVHEWTKEDPETAAEWVVQLPTENKLRDDSIGIVADVWVNKDPETAAEWVLRLPGGLGREKAFRSLIYSWAIKDRKAILKWAMSLPEGDDKNGILAEVADKWARQNPQAALEWAKQLPKGTFKDNALCGIAESLLNKDISIAQKLLMQVSDNFPQKEDVLTKIVCAISQRNPVKAAELVMQSSKSVQYFSLMTVAANWARKDPEATVRWLEQLPKERDESTANEWTVSGPEGDEKHRVLNLAFKETAYYWADRNPKAAAEWAEQLPEGSGKDMAIFGVANKWAEKDIYAAAEWANQVPQGKGQNRALTCVAKVWAKEDPVAAKKWAERLHVSEELQERLLKIIKGLSPQWKSDQ